MSTTAVTLDMSKAQPINQASTQPVTLDLSKAVPITGPGEQLNEIGQKVIVPAEGEDFAATMKRAAAYGENVSPQQINAEIATAPKKAGQVGLAALLGGAAFPAAVAGGEAAAPLIAPAAKAVASWTTAHPIATAFAYHVARELGIPLPKVLDVMSKFQGQ